MAGEYGTKELGEALDFSLDTSVFLTERIADGRLNGEDFEAFWNKITKDDAFKAKAKLAWEGHELIPAEARDLDLAESLGLGMKVLSRVPDFVEAFTKGKEGGLNPQPAPVDPSIPKDPLP